MKDRGFILIAWSALLFSAVAIGGMFYTAYQGPRAIRDFNEAIKADKERKEIERDIADIELRKIEAMTENTEAVRRLAETNLAVAESMLNQRKLWEAQHEANRKNAGLP